MKTEKERLQDLLDSIEDIIDKHYPGKKKFRRNEVIKLIKGIINGTIEGLEESE